MNHTHFLKEEHLPDWEFWDEKVTKHDHVDHETKTATKPHSVMYLQYHKGNESILFTVPSIDITAQKKKVNFHYIISERINF